MASYEENMGSTKTDASYTANDAFWFREVSEENMGSTKRDASYTVNDVFRFREAGSFFRKKKRQNESNSSNKMKSDEIRGYVVVIINHKFPKQYKNLPMGNDIGEIKDLFRDYGYKVRGFTNLSASEMCDKVGKYAEKGGSHSLVCFISSHGNRTSLLGADGKTVAITDLFRKADSTALQGKPKTFFIDACRSDVDGNVTVDQIPDLPSSDFFVGLSCLGSASSTAKGRYCGIYFEALLTVFKESFRLPAKEHSKIRDISHLITKVHNLVHEHKDTEGRKVQLPETKHTLAGKYFLQGENTNCS